MFLDQNEHFRSECSSGRVLIFITFEARSLTTNFETLLCWSNLLKILPWITLPYNQWSPNCRVVRPSVTTQVPLFPLCSEILSSWKSQWSSSCKVLKAREDLEHKLSRVSCSCLEPDLSSRMPRWFLGLRSFLLRNLLKYLCSLPISHVKLWGACRAWQWGRHLLAPLHRNLSKEGASLKVSFANYLPKSTWGPSTAQQSLTPCRGDAVVLVKRGAKPWVIITHLLQITRLICFIFIKSFSPAARTHFATQKCKCNSPI